MSTLIAGDLVMRAAGSPSLIDDKIPRTKKYGYNPALMDAAKLQSIRLAHYNAGLNGSNWRTEHAKIYPGLGDDTRNTWNALVSELERSECRRVGALVRCKTPLTPEDEAIQSPGHPIRSNNGPPGVGFAETLIEEEGGKFGASNSPSPALENRLIRKPSKRNRETARCPTPSAPGPNARSTRIGSSGCAISSKTIISTGKPISGPCWPTAALPRRSSTAPTSTSTGLTYRPFATISRLKVCGASPS